VGLADDRLAALRIILWERTVSQGEGDWFRINPPWRSPQSSVIGVAEVQGGTVTSERASIQPIKAHADQIVHEAETSGFADRSRRRS